MLDALIYLAAAVVAVPLARRSGLGSILGYLIGGAIIGPWGLRLVTDVEATLHFSESGVVLMLFVIGLELDAQRLWSMRREVFGGGLLQIALSGGAIALAPLGLGFSGANALLIGVALALSSTAIALQLLGERNLLAAPVGRSAFSVLLFQDVAVLPLLAAIPLRARNVSHYVKLRTRGVQVIERETFESALRLGRHALVQLGVDPYRARRMADAFRRHNVTNLDILVPDFHDEVQVLSAARRPRRTAEAVRPRPRPARRGARIELVAHALAGARAG